MRRRRGFTFIEILTAMTVIALIAAIAVPKTGDFIKRARASVAVSQIRAIQSALAAYYVDSLSYPPTAALGQMPRGLGPYMDPNFSFVRDGYQLEYSRWDIFTVVSAAPTMNTVIGVTVNTDDARFGQLIMAQLKTTVQFQSGNNYTFIIDGL